MAERRTGPGDPSEGGGGRQPARRPLTSEDLERIIHRAAELQFGEREPPSDVLDEEEVLRIGREVGLPQRHLRQALSELRAEALLPELPEEVRPVRRLFGEAMVRAVRVVPGAPEEVQSRLEEHLRERESLTRVRGRAGASLWEPAGGFRAQMQRAVNWEGRGYQLAKPARLELTVTELDEGWSLVALTADLRNVRRDHLLGWTLPSFATLGGVSVGVAVLTAVSLPVALGAAAATAAGGSTLGVRATFPSQRERVRLRMEGLLDRVERGEPLDERRTSWRQRFLE